MTAGVLTAALTLLTGGVVAQEAPVLRGVLPVVGSTAGAFGSNFKTSLQMHNKSDEAVSGVLVFRQQGVAGSATDASLQFTLEPHETVEYEDIVAVIGRDGLGSLDLRMAAGVSPTIVARAYDDKDENGTTGVGVRLVGVSEVLGAEERSSLLVPGNLDRFRFNIGIRTVGEGAFIRATVYGQNGIVRFTSTDMFFPVDYFVQKSAEDFVGTPLLSNESIVIEVLAGKAVLYGTTTDNKTNDPSIQFAAAR